MPAMSERNRYEVGPYTDALFTLAKEVDPGAYVMNYALGDGSNGRWVYVTGEDAYNIVMILTGVFEPEPRTMTAEFAAALERHRGTAMEVRR